MTSQKFLSVFLWDHFIRWDRIIPVNLCPVTIRSRLMKITNPLRFKYLQVETRILFFFCLHEMVNVVWFWSKEWRNAGRTEVMKEGRKSTSCFSTAFCSIYKLKMDYYLGTLLVCCCCCRRIYFYYMNFFLIDCVMVVSTFLFPFHSTLFNKSVSKRSL